MSLFSAQNRVPLTVPGGEAAQPSIQVDSNLRRWFSRNLGLWRSRRQYTFSDDQVLHLDMNLKMEAFAHPQVGESATASAGGLIKKTSIPTNFSLASPGLSAVARWKPRCGAINSREVAVI